MIISKQQDVMGRWHSIDCEFKLEQGGLTRPKLSATERTMALRRAGTVLERTS